MSNLIRAQKPNSYCKSHTDQHRRAQIKDHAKSAHVRSRRRAIVLRGSSENQAAPAMPVYFTSTLVRSSNRNTRPCVRTATWLETVLARFLARLNQDCVTGRLLENAFDFLRSLTRRFTKL